MDFAAHTRLLRKATISGGERYLFSSLVFFIFSPEQLHLVSLNVIKFLQQPSSIQSRGTQLHTLS